MSGNLGFKKPTIRETNRAYARLYEYFASREDWISFLEQYRVEYVSWGLHKNGDCAIQVVDPANGELASLGIETPCEIKYHTHAATGRSFWNERFQNESQVRTRTIEVGCRQPSKDELRLR